ncbi:hypothetical protein OG943_01525 [Amycolatopsis sp. NBC_00345]|uniref:hypothetical protein n=1 Tax=Amycolatopsis sp. NBC_00345 TaxID=2975955 RepID=UPI002E26E4DD
MSSVPPPYQFPPGAPPAEPGVLGRLLAGVLGAFAAVLVITGTFLPVWAYQESSDGKVQASQSVTAWTRLFGIEPTATERAYYDTNHVAHYGIPLTVAALVLLAGAVLVFTRARSAGRVTLVAGGAGVVAAVWMLGMDVSATLSYDRQTDLTKFHYTSGTGFWVLLAGGVVALITLGLALLSGRRPRPAGIAGAPPFGYPVSPPPSYGNSVPTPYETPAHGVPVPQPFPFQPPPNEPPSHGFLPRTHDEPVSQPFPPQPSQPMPVVPPSEPLPEQPQSLPGQEEGPGRHRTTDEPNT